MLANVPNSLFRLGLSIKSAAPAFLASSSEKFTFDVTIMHGTGYCDISSLTNSKPFIFGISTSITITSGFSSATISFASKASLAVPTTSSERLSDSFCASASRKSRESSTIISFFFLILIEYIYEWLQTVHTFLSLLIFL